MRHIGKMMAARPIRKCKLRPSLYFLCLLIVLGTICFYSKLDFTVLRGFGLQIETIFVKVLDSNEYVLKTPGCTITKYDPLDSRIAFYFYKLKPMVCPTNAEDVLIYTEDGLLKVHEKGRRDIIEASRQKFKENSVDFKCRRWKVYRKYIEANDDIFRLSENYTEFMSSAPVEDNYVKVECFFNGHSVYHNYFYNVVKVPEVENQCAVNEKEFLKRHPQCDADRLSILIFGIDSVSKVNFLCHLQQTYNFIMSSISALEFFGYNRVGMNTFPCLMPLLMGNTQTELENTCWGGGDNCFDNCTTVWDRFADGGYRTAYVENMNDYTPFNYGRKGFKRQPAHYYGRPLYMAAGNYVINFSSHCWRGLPDDEHVAQWAVQFQHLFHDVPHFGYFWMSLLSHDHLNDVQHMEPFVVDSIRKMAEGEKLNKTLLILMSDHFIRFGSFRETEFGLLEENLPFLFLMFPGWFREKYPNVMKRLDDNRHRLITTFDLHETLKSVLYCDYNNASFMAINQSFREKGVSLFQNISPDRTCGDAGIPAIYCTCFKDIFSQDVNLNESKKVASLLVDALNAYTESHRNICVEFSIKTILSVKKFKFSGNSGNSSALLEDCHIVTILTEPSDAKFEGHFLRFAANDTFIVKEEIRRINRYGVGNTLACIKNDPVLKFICYCKIQNS